MKVLRCFVAAFGEMEGVRAGSLREIPPVNAINQIDFRFHERSKGDIDEARDFGRAKTTEAFSDVPGDPTGGVSELVLELEIA